MKALSERQIRRCEEAHSKRCRCRCKGALHGVANKIPGTVPDSDAHHAKDTKS
jgi:hypothetical protein